MDTIAVNLIFKREFSRMEVVYEIKDYIRNITSPYGYRYCDILPNNSKNQILVKISYPRYFYGNNAYLIKTSDECFEVQEDFVKALRHSLFTKLQEIELTRLDIPFTYVMDRGERFPNFSNLFKVMGEVYYYKNSNGRPKAFIDLITEEKESIIFTDSKTSSAYNSKVTIYDQYLNLERKLPAREFEKALDDFNELPYRMRIEVSKRIRRKGYSLEEFADADLFEHYKEEYKKYIFENLLNFRKIEILYEKQAQELSKRLKKEIKSRGFSYGHFILMEEKYIYDYEILRKAVKLAIENRKTRENAITTIKKILSKYEDENRKIVLKVFKRLEEIEEMIENN